MIEVPFLMPQASVRPPQKTRAGGTRRMKRASWPADRHAPALREPQRNARGHMACPSTPRPGNLSAAPTFPACSNMIHKPLASAATLTFTHRCAAHRPASHISARSTPAHPAARCAQAAHARARHTDLWNCRHDEAPPPNPTPRAIPAAVIGPSDMRANAARPPAWLRQDDAASLASVHKA
jgi:hypothetical protein